MEPFSIVGLIIVVILAFFFGKILRITIQVLFYTLLAVLIFVFVFGVSYTELLVMTEKILLWVF